MKLHKIAIYRRKIINYFYYNMNNNIYMNSFKYPLSWNKSFTSSILWKHNRRFGSKSWRQGCLFTNEKFILSHR
jgi:hypothetical protein